MGLQPYQLKAFLRRPVFRSRPSVRPRGRRCESQVGKIATFLWEINGFVHQKLNGTLPTDRFRGPFTGSCWRFLGIWGVLPHLGSILVVSHTNIQLPFIYQNISSSNTYVYLYPISEKKHYMQKVSPLGPQNPWKMKVLEPEHMGQNPWKWWKRWFPWSLCAGFFLSNLLPVQQLRCVRSGETPQFSTNEWQIPYRIYRM